MKGLRVLVVDDDEALGMVLQHMLNGEGYETQSARNAAEAWRIFPVFQPGLVISDLQMPGGSGVQVVRQMRKMTVSDCRIIFISGDLNQFPAELEAERENHQATLLPKPFSRTELVRLIEEIESAMATRAA